MPWVDAVGLPEPLAMKLLNDLDFPKTWRNPFDGFSQSLVDYDGFLAFAIVPSGFSFTSGENGLQPKFYHRQVTGGSDDFRFVFDSTTYGFFNGYGSESGNVDWTVAITPSSLTDPAPVPLPLTALLLGGGLAWLGALRSLKTRLSYTMELRNNHTA